MKILFTLPSAVIALFHGVYLYLGYHDKTPVGGPEALRNVPYLPFDGMNEMGFASMMSVAHAEG